MSDHLSALSLDEAAAGLALSTETQAHLGGCEACRAKLEAARAQAAQVAARPGAQRTLDAVLSKVDGPPAKKPAPRWLTLAAVALPLAAGLLLLVFNPVKSDDSRLKGGPTLELVDAQGRSVTKAKPGEQLELNVGGAGYGYVVVMAVDAQGINTLWPAGSSTMGVVEPGARFRLQSFVVTPGDVRLIALFSKKQRFLGGLTTPLVNAVVKRAQARQPTMEVEVPKDLADAVASVTLEVAP